MRTEFFPMYLSHFLFVICDDMQLPELERFFQTLGLENVKHLS